eukprot:TRINITY_DN32136_c0_g1_i1.p1 TRINITY_DN32136_c0_g1~~TRINITY_DN32136_c0_g1_i1.p1  ORF type:complete len:610 (-),score=112.55 TRINITY_DN32136_c0_g1_i1:20-1849(-)
MADWEYLRPVVKWATEHPAHARFKGANFFTVYAMDLGRQDFPAVLASTANWTVGSLTGRSNWLQEADVWALEESLEAKRRDRCEDETLSTNAGREVRKQDFVIPIPSRFRITADAKVFDRPRLAFFAGSLNSCSRRWLHSLYGNMDKEEVWIHDKILAEKEYRAAMHASKYCLILRGSSHTNNVRLYDVIAHGCIPVIISDDFQPPLEEDLVWHDTAIFLRTAELPKLLGLLRAIPDERRKLMLERNTDGQFAAGICLDWREAAFWSKMFVHACRLMKDHISDSRGHHGWLDSAANLKQMSLGFFREFLEEIQCPWAYCSENTITSNVFSCAGAEAIWPALNAIRNRAFRGKDGRMRAMLVVDAEAGDGVLTSMAMSEVEMPPLCSYSRESYARLDIGCSATLTKRMMKVVALETSEDSIKALDQKALQNDWAVEGKDENWNFMMLPTRLGAIGIDQADTTSLMQIRDKYFSDENIFLLRLRGKSSTLATLQGMQMLLWPRGKLLRFLIFEYEVERWSNSEEPSSLEDAVVFMFSMGYVCFLMAKSDLFAVSGILWDKAYQNVAFSNIFCSAIDDPSLPAILATYPIENYSRSDKILTGLRKQYDQEFG